MGIIDARRTLKATQIRRDVFSFFACCWKRFHYGSMLRVLLASVE